LFAVLASKHAHWNVKGAGFYPAHKLFDSIYEFYSESADTIAERITALGGVARGELQDVSGNSEIIYDADASDNVRAHIMAMADMLGQVSNLYRAGINVVGDDKATQDVLIELTRAADKFLYFLEAELRA
jgi:starvation-inducible DNA-binding protein